MDYHGMMRRVDIFGPDADVFRPSRWTEANEEVYNRMFRTQELVFGTSRYTCLGKNVAIMELDKVFVEVRCAPFFSFLIFFPFSYLLTQEKGEWWMCTKQPQPGMRVRKQDES